VSSRSNEEGKKEILPLKEETQTLRVHAVLAQRELLSFCSETRRFG